MTDWARGVYLDFFFLMSVEGVAERITYVPYYYYWCYYYSEEISQTDSYFIVSVTALYSAVLNYDQSVMVVSSAQPVKYSFQ